MERASIETRNKINYAIDEIGDKLNSSTDLSASIYDILMEKKKGIDIPNVGMVRQELIDEFEKGYIEKIAVMPEADYDKYIKWLNRRNILPEQKGKFYDFFKKVRNKFGKGIFKDKSNTKLYDKAKDMKIDMIALEYNEKFLQYNGGEDRRFSKKIYFSMPVDKRIEMAKEIIKGQNEQGFGATFKINTVGQDRQEGIVIYCTSENYEKTVSMLYGVKEKRPDLFEGLQQSGLFSDFSSGFLSTADESRYATSFNDVRCKALSKAVEYALVEEAANILNEGNFVNYGGKSMDFESALYYALEDRFKGYYDKSEHREFQKDISQYTDIVVNDIKSGSINVDSNPNIKAVLTKMINNIREVNPERFNDIVTKNFEVTSNLVNVSAMNTAENLDNNCPIKTKEDLERDLSISYKDLKKKKRDEALRRQVEDAENGYNQSQNQYSNNRYDANEFVKQVPNIADNVNVRKPSVQPTRQPAVRTRTIVATREKEGKIQSKYMFEVGEKQVNVYKNGNLVGVNDIRTFMNNNGLPVSNNLDQNVNLIMQGTNSKFRIDTLDNQTIETPLNVRRAEGSEKTYSFNSNHGKEYDIAIEGNTVKASRNGERLDDMTLQEFALANNVAVYEGYPLNADYVMSQLSNRNSVLLSYTSDNGIKQYLEPVLGTQIERSISKYTLNINHTTMRVDFGMDEITIYDANNKVIGIEDKQDFCGRNNIYSQSKTYGDNLRLVLPTNDEIAASIYESKNINFLNERGNVVQSKVDEIIPEVTMDDIENNAQMRNELEDDGMGR